MSHFTVLVIGDNPEEQLAPFQEFECTGRDDEYVQDLDETEERREEYANANEETKKKYPDFLTYATRYHDHAVVPHGEEPDLEKKHKYGYVLLDASGKVERYVNRTNPNAKWDWYVLGGRWTGYFKLKDGIRTHKVGEPGLMTEIAEVGHADQCRKGDIDIEAMRNEAARTGLEQFDEVVAVIAGREIIPWEKVRTELCKDDIDAARKRYNEQPAVKDLQTKRLLPFMDDLRDVYCNFDRDRFVAQQRSGAIVTFALIKDGEWYENGSMGWWGVVSDEKKTEDWHEEYAKLFDALPDDTLVSVYDCHI